jgi:hypothetical protein
MLAFLSLPLMAAEAVTASPSIMAIVFGCLFAVSEVLASIPALNANSIFQLVLTILKALAGKSVAVLTLLFIFVALPAFAADSAIETPSVFTIIMGCLWAISEVLASIPKLGANSIFQLIKVVLKEITGE